MDYKSTLMWKELNEAKDVLKTLRERNAGVLQSVAAAAEKAGVANVYTAARGTSDHAMIFLKYLIEGRLGIPVASGAPSAVTMYGTKMKFSNALVIGCSQSGKAADVMEIVRAGNESGANLAYSGGVAVFRIVLIDKVQHRLHFIFAAFRHTVHLHVTTIIP